ncbi:MAG: hypothetical protein HQ578_06460, partial [Chloroflexi bacterium]|nr:hypothetical protein [Chloroflexota bacterium]
FVTPGGHRRYSRTDLRRFAGMQGKVHGVKDLVSGLEEAALLQRETAQTSFPETEWYGKLSPSSHRSLAQFGRQLLDLVIRYITEPARRDEIVDDVRGVGRDFGSELVGLGMPLTDTLEAFLLHRTPFVNVVTNLMKKREALDERALEAIPLVNRIMDEALMSLVTVYQEQQVLPHPQRNGDSVR